MEKAQSVVVGEDGDKDFEASPSVAGTAEEYDASTSRATSEQQSHGSEGTAPELSGYLFKAGASRRLSYFGCRSSVVDFVLCCCPLNSRMGPCWQPVPG